MRIVRSIRLTRGCMGCDMNKSLKNDRDWLLETLSEKKTEIIDDIHAVVYQSEDMRVKCKGNMCLHIVGNKLEPLFYKELYIDCNGECQVVYKDLKGEETEIELWQFSFDELWEMIEDFMV